MVRKGEGWMGRTGRWLGGVGTKKRAKEEFRFSRRG